MSSIIILRWINLRKLPFDNTNCRGGLRCLLRLVGFLRAKSASGPPHSNGYDCCHYQHKPGDSDKDHKSERERQRDDDDANYDDENIRQWIACRQLIISKLLIQCFSTLLLFARVKTFKPRYPGHTLVVRLFKKLSYPTIGQQREKRSKRNRSASAYRVQITNQAHAFVG